MFEQNNGCEDTYLASIHSLVINYNMSILVTNKIYTDTSDHMFLVNVKIGECMGPCCKHKV